MAHQYLSPLLSYTYESYVVSCVVALLHVLMPPVGLYDVPEFLGPDESKEVDNRWVLTYHLATSDVSLFLYTSPCVSGVTS